jgi:5-methylcytosine-specific restriction endonuclease McrA
VWDRDHARCAYLDDRGERCRETSGLEIHHRHAYSLGGPATLENLELRCRAHNTLAAEQDFGREHMDWMRGTGNGAAQAREDGSASVSKGDAAAAR